MRIGHPSVVTRTSLAAAFASALLLIGPPDKPFGAARAGQAADSKAAGPAEPPASPVKPGSTVPPSPAEALKLMKIAPGLRIELVAAEPQIESPVAMAFDEHGRLFVVEMRDYPNGPGPGRPPEGRIKMLEDRDGVFETAAVFADNLLFANGLLPWMGGLIVTAAPHILYLKDTDGDGKADLREIWYEGFATQNPQLRVSHPILGLDGRVYCANGLRGGAIIRHGDKTAKPVNIGGMDFRFDPSNLSRYEAVSGAGQFGNTFDDWGRRFVCDNRNHLRHVVLESRYIRRNPYLALGSPLEDVCELETGPLSSGVRVFPLSKNWTTSNLHAGRFTAACGVMIYRGRRLGGEFDGGAFTCDPTGNLVHHEVLRPHGATFRSRPARDGVEFLASPDDWFRPVFLSHGPDGAMYVVDMCRAVIEHPEFMPPELKNRPDLTLGKDRGRIWRIVPEGRPAAGGARPWPGKMTTEQLVAALEHDESWWRVTAQRLLLERRDKAAVEPLEALLEQSKSAQARVHAAWLLEALSPSEDRAAALMDDEHPGVRENAVGLAERLVAAAGAVPANAIHLAADEDGRVRFAAALLFGESKGVNVEHDLVRAAAAHPEDRWLRLAVQSAPPERARGVLDLLAAGWRGSTPPTTVAQARRQMLRELAAIIGARGEPADIESAARALTAPDRLGRAPESAAAVVNGLADGMGRRGVRLGEFARTKLSGPAREAVEKVIAPAAGIASDAAREPAERVEAVRLLAHAERGAAEPVLAKLLADEPVQEVRLAAARALGSQAYPEVAGVLMRPWKSLTPAVRREVAEAMLRTVERTTYLLDQIEAKRAAPGDLDQTQVRRLVSHPRPEIRGRAGKLLAESVPADRKRVLEEYRESLKPAGDPARGREVFKKQCATCHRVAGVGVDVGPDISDTRTKTPEMLLTDILNPNAAIDANYVGYTVRLKDEKVLTGIIVAETAAGITLRRAENQTELVLRADIEEIRSTGQSLMPEGVEKNVSKQEMADLIAFLKNWRYVEGQAPGR
jgi:putative membrane-bound dehydrogenase-like protein